MKFLRRLIVTIAAIIAFLYLNNEWIQTTNITFEASNIPSAFDGYKITQITDLHDSELGENHAHLLKNVRETNPDIIVFTGDVIDSRRFDLEHSMEAMEQLVEIAPVYYVQGNHEVATNEVEEIYTALQEVGVQPLRNENRTIEKDGESISIAGIEDPLTGVPTEQMIEQATLTIPNDQFSVLLAHRPENFKTYVDRDVQLVLTGHAHGGQVRIPFIGGIIAPTQGLFPTYTSGLYTENSTTMLVNRGLGNSLFPFRIFNRPEVISITLHSN